MLALIFFLRFLSIFHMSLALRICIFFASFLSHAFQVISKKGSKCGGVAAQIHMPSSFLPSVRMGGGLIAHLILIAIGGLLAT